MEHFFADVLDEFDLSTDVPSMTAVGAFDVRTHPAARPFVEFGFFATAGHFVELIEGDGISAFFRTSPLECLLPFFLETVP